MKDNNYVVSVGETEVSSNDTWVKGELDTRISGSDEQLAPNLDTRLELSVWFLDEDEVGFDLSRSDWLHLTKEWQYHYRSQDLVSTKLTLAELRMVHQTLGQFLQDLQNGKIISREREYEIRREIREEQDEE